MSTLPPAGRSSTTPRSRGRSAPAASGWGRAGRAARAGLAGVLVAGLAACGASAAASPSHSSAAGPAANPAAATDGGISPRPALARKDSGEVYSRGCASGYQDDAVHPCVFDYGTSADAPLVVAAGDSKMAQWVPALEVIAQQQHWKLITMTKSGCAFTETHRVWKKKDYTSCVIWNRSVAADVLRLAPDLLVTTELDLYHTLRHGKKLKGAANRAEMVRGLTERITQMRTAGIPVATVAETPRMGFDTAACVRDHLDDLAACARPRSQVLGNAGVVHAAAERSGASFIDLTSSFCSSTSCPAVRGNLLVYRDKHHLTATYARSLAPVFAADLAGSLTTDVRARLFGG